MSKIQNFSELIFLRDDLKKKLWGKKEIDASGPVKIKVAMATCSIASGAGKTMNYLKEELEKRSIDAIVSQTGCMGYCYAEPTIEISLPGKGPVVFGDVDIYKADLIIEKYIKEGDYAEGIVPVNYRTID